jgi:hypothetical protein
MVKALPMRKIDYPHHAQYVGLFTNTLMVILWVCGLWLWATVLEYTSDWIDLIIVGLTAPFALAFFWRKPEYGIIALIFFASGFLAPNFVDIRLPFFGGLEMRDILLVVLFLLGLVRGLVNQDLRIPWWPVGGFLLAFMLMMLFSLFHALFLENVPGNWALSDVRILVFYSVFFITAWSIKSKQALYTLIIGSFVIADITAAIVIIQQYLGPDNYFLSSMNDPSWQVYRAEGAVRVVPPGIVFMYFMILVSLGLSFFWHVGWKKTLFWIFHTLFLSIGLIFTFTRSAWAATGISLVLLMIFLFPAYKAYLLRIIVLGTAALMLFGGLMGLYQSSFSAEGNSAVQSVIERFTSIFTVEDTLETNSLQWRYFENQEATKAIEDSPWIGVGLGNNYRLLTTFQGEARGLWTDGDLSYIRLDRFTRYVHSSYFAIAVKMGLPALIIFLSFLFSAIFKSVTLHRRLPDSMAKGLALPIGMALVGLMQWSFLHAHLILASSTAVIGLMVGILASIHYLYVSYPQHYTIF